MSQNLSSGSQNVSKPSLKVSKLSQNLLLLTKNHLASCLYTLARFQEGLFITESTLNNCLNNIYAPKTRDGNGQSCGLAEAATMPLTLGLHLPPSTWVMPEPADAGVQGPHNPPVRAALCWPSPKTAWSLVFFTSTSGV